MVAMARAAVALDAVGKRHLDSGPAGFKGLCLNVAAIDGGVAFNVIPSEARLSLCIRPGPGEDIHRLFAECEAAARGATGDPITWEVQNANPAFETRDLGGFLPLLGERARQPVDLAFWTEAALYADRGIDAVVFGPGHIEQAHAADEYVETTQLETARDVFLQALRVVS
jgi:acetylornithine deacetylase